MAVSATVAQVFMTLGYHHARATTASIVSLFTPFIAALFGILFFKDAPTWATWLGGALILAAGMLLTRER
ncbi:EamA-like transporter family protein [compost metagenome]